MPNRNIRCRLADVVRSSSEKDDEVMVAFINGDFNQGVVMGFAVEWHGQAVICQQGREVTDCPL